MYDSGRTEHKKGNTMYVSISKPVTAVRTGAGKNQDAGNVSHCVRALFAEAHESDDVLVVWLQEQRKKIPAPVLLARFATGEYSNDRLEALLDLGFDSWIIGVPPLSLIEKICAKVTGDFMCKSSKYGLLFQQGNLFWREKEQVKLSTKESQILRMLLTARNATVSIEQLLVAHGYKPDTNTHTIESHIYRLKLKLQRLGMENVIVNIKKEGYKIDL